MLEDESQVATVPNDQNWIDLIDLAWQYQIVAMEDWSTVIGSYRFKFNAHSTGKHLEIYALMGDEELLVWSRDQWISSRYGSEAKPQGWIHEGPWESEIQEYVADIAKNVAAFEEKKQRHAERMKQQQEDDFSKKVERFRKSFAE